MNKFEEAICGHNPLYKEGLQDKYYQGAKWAWQSRQAEVEEKDKRIKDIESMIKNQIENLKYASRSWVYTEREQNIMISQADDLEKVLRCENQ